MDLILPGLFMDSRGRSNFSMRAITVHSNSSRTVEVGRSNIDDLLSLTLGRIISI